MTTPHRARRKTTARTANGKLPIDLALQGGGSHGAFTWGVLDRLLEEDGLEIAAISGTSAGAMNAVALAAGLMDGGRAGAQRVLRQFWTRVAEISPFHTLQSSPLGTAFAPAPGNDGRGRCRLGNVVGTRQQRFTLLVPAKQHTSIPFDARQCNLMASGQTQINDRSGIELCILTDKQTDAGRTEQECTACQALGGCAGVGLLLLDAEVAAQRTVVGSQRTTRVRARIAVE